MDVTFLKYETFYSPSNSNPPLQEEIQSEEQNWLLPVPLLNNDCPELVEPSTAKLVVNEEPTTTDIIPCKTTTQVEIDIPPLEYLKTRLLRIFMR